MGLLCVTGLIGNRIGPWFKLMKQGGGGLLLHALAGAAVILAYLTFVTSYVALTKLNLAERKGRDQNEEDEEVSTK